MESVQACPLCGGTDGGPIFDLPEVFHGCGRCFSDAADKAKKAPFIRLRNELLGEISTLRQELATLRAEWNQYRYSSEDNEFQRHYPRRPEASEDPLEESTSEESGFYLVVWCPKCRGDSLPFDEALGRFKCPTCGWVDDL